MQRRLTLLRLTAVLFVLAGVGALWRPDTGFTALIGFGHDFDGRRLPQLETRTLAIVPGAGYDGQYYAQLAVQPDVTDPALQRALDVPAYRARRILLPLVAHVAGFGHARATLEIYALLNTVCWLALAWCWWRWLPDHGARGTTAWLASVLSLGALDNVRFSLTDLPMMLALALGVRALERGRGQLAAAAFLAAGFVRETAVLALQPFGAGRTPRERRAAWRRAALCTAPVALWCAFLAWRVPGPSLGVAGNFDWPGVAFGRHLLRCAHELGQGNFDSRYLFGLIGAASLAYQSVYLLRRWRSPDPWLRLGVPFAALFWLLGDYVWHGYWAVARTTLPMLFVFNRAILAERRPAAHLLAGNLFVLHSVYRFLPF